MSLTTTYLPFQTPIIKNAKVVKIELNPFLQNIISHHTQPLPFENEPHTIETIPLIREHLDTYLFYIRYKVLTITEEYPTFQISFLQQRLNSSHIYRRTINPINLQVPIKQVFYAFLNNVKDHNLAQEIPKVSPNALDDLQRYIDNFDVEIIERLVIPEDNPHHWLQADILRIQNFIYHYFKDLTLNDQTIPQIKVISLFLRKYFRFNYQLLWSQQDQSAFTAFPDHFTLEECLPFIISEQNEHPYFHKPQSITKQTLDYIRFDPLLITENDLFADNRPYHYEQNSQDQQNLHFNTNNSTEDDNTDQENTTQQQNQPENYNDNEFTTQESTISTHNPSQTGTSTSVHTQSFRVPTRVVNQRQTTHSPQSHLATSPNRNITFNLPHTDDTHDETHDTFQDDILTTSGAQNTSVSVASPTRTNPDYTRYITRSRFDHQFPPPFAQTDRPLPTTILMIMPKLPTDVTIHLIITFILHQIQLPIQISTNITLKLIQLQQHKTPSYNYQIPILHRIYILEIKEPRIFPLLILISHRILKGDFITLHLHIYQLILCIKCIQIQILTLIQIHYHKIQSNIYFHHSHNN